MSDLPGRPPSRQKSGRGWAKYKKVWDETVRAEYGSHISQQELDETWDKLRNEHPVQAVLTVAGWQRLNRAEALYRRGLPTVLKERHAIIGKIIALHHEFSELRSWEPKKRKPLVSSGKQTAEPGRRHPSGLTKEELIGGIEWCMQKGFPADFIYDFLNPDRRMFRGRPIAKRGLAVQALEAKRLNPRLSWSGLAKLFCDCGQKAHDFKCRERIRRNVGHLKRMLSDHNIQLPESRGNKPP